LTKVAVAGVLPPGFNHPALSFLRLELEMLGNISLKDFASTLTSVSEADVHKDISLSSRLLLVSDGALTITYAPFEYIQAHARLVLVGITPGEQQARNALLEARRCLIEGNDFGTAIRKAKVFASFSGGMRSNLISLLDHIGLQDWLGISSVSEVWTTRSDLVHFTSALRYPVFIGGRNYAGTPSMTRTLKLRALLDQCLRNEARSLPDAVWVPLGPKAAEGLEWLIVQNAIDRNKVLLGLPHPSGANAERIAYFLGRKARTTLSAKTNPDALDQAKCRLLEQVKGLSTT
jgi:hypothetical protein